MKFMIANLLLAFLPGTRWFGLKRRLLRMLGVDIADGASVCGHVQFHGAGRIAIGQATWIGPNTRFYTGIGGDIRIGDRCDVAPEVMFITGTHQIGGNQRRAGDDVTAPIEIGAGSWIGARALVLPGATIGNGSIVAAGSLVRGHATLPNTMLMGIPARTVRDLEP